MRDLRALAWASVPALAIAALTLRPLLGMHGVPAFHHDWSWPPDRDAAWQTFLDYLRPYTRGNFGAPNFYAGGAPVAGIVALFIAAFGSALGLKALTFGLSLATTLGAFALARRIGAGPLVAAAAAVAYGASPVIAHELGAGHVAYLFGYASLPYVALCGLALGRGAWTRGWLGLLAVVPISIAQPQFAIFDALVLLAMLPAAGDRRARATLSVAAACCLLVAPLALALAAVADPLDALRFDRTNAHWLAANSSALWPSFAGSAVDLPWIGAVGCLGVWVLATWNAFADRRWLAALALAAVAALIAAGANGPLWGAIAFAASRVPELSLFRELYHFSGVVAFGAIVGLCATRGLARSVAAAIAAGLFAAPQLAGAFWNASSAYDPSRIASIAETVASDPSDGFVLYWPLLQPLGPSPAQSGADPDAFPIGTHPGLSMFTVGQPLSQLETMLCAAHTDARRVLALAGVQYVVLRPQWRSAFAQTIEPGLQPLVAHRPACAADASLARLPVRVRDAEHVLLVVEPTAPAATRGDLLWTRLAVERSFEPNDLTPDPRLGWVDASRWQWWGEGAFMGPVNPGVFALGGVPFALPPSNGAGFVLLDAPAGATIRTGGADLRVPPAAGYRAVALPPNARTIVSGGPAVLGGYARSATVFAGGPAIGSPVWSPLVWVGLVLQYLVWLGCVAAVAILAFRGSRLPGR